MENENLIERSDSVKKKSARWLFLAAIYGFLGVTLGAFGAHALHDLLAERGYVDSWNTAVKYQFIHALAIAFLALWVRSEPASVIACRRIVFCWGLGVLLFSGSIYLLTTQGWKWLGPVTPIGGLLMLAGWALLAVMALKSLKIPEKG